MIVDASAFIILLGSPSSSNAELAKSDLAAPDLIVSETLNAFWKLARAGMTTPDRADILALLDAVSLEPSRPYASRAANLADEIDHPVYDCLYLALAEARDEILLTADARMSRKLNNHKLGKQIHLINSGG